MSRYVQLLVARRWWRFRFVHLVIACLVAAVLMAVLMFQGYLVSLRGEFSGQIVSPSIPSEILAYVAPGYQSPVVTDAKLQLKLTVWDIVAPPGKVEMAAVSNSQLPNWQEPPVGEVLLPQSQRGHVYRQEVGDQITLTQFAGRGISSAKALVAGYYEDGGLLSPVLVNHAWVHDWVKGRAKVSILAYPEQASKQLQYWLGRTPNSKLVTPASIAQAANGMVDSIFSGGQMAIIMGALFLALGFGVLALLVFLDSRTELAVLKALGLRPGEAAILFWAEFGLAALLGLMLGGSVLTLLKWQFGSLVTLDFAVLRMALAVIAGAFTLAMLAPARMASRAQVNELLLRRPVLLWSQIISTPVQHQPGLQDLISRGWSCLRLHRDADSFTGAVLRAESDTVKQGETIAWQSTCFGLGERRYVAPHDGVLELVDQMRGVLAISRHGQTPT